MAAKTNAPPANSEPDEDVETQADDIQSKIEMNDPTLSGREAVEQNLAAQAKK